MVPARNGAPTWPEPPPADSNVEPVQTVAANSCAASPAAPERDGSPAAPGALPAVPAGLPVVAAPDDPPDDRLAVAAWSAAPDASRCDRQPARSSVAGHRSLASSPGLRLRVHDSPDRGKCRHDRDRDVRAGSVTPRPRRCSAWSRDDSPVPLPACGNRPRCSQRHAYECVRNHRRRSWWSRRGCAACLAACRQAESFQRRCRAAQQHHHWPVRVRRCRDVARSP